MQSTGWKIRLFFNSDNTVVHAILRRHQLSKTLVAKRVQLLNWGIFVFDEELAEYKSWIHQQNRIRSLKLQE